MMEWEIGLCFKDCITLDVMPLRKNQGTRFSAVHVVR